MKKKKAILCTISASLCTTLSLAHAAETDNASYAIEELPPELRIVGGQKTKTCHFPSTVWIGNCTGTLVHPQIVTTANHCLRGSTQSVNVTFGETGRASYKVRAQCKAYRGGSSAPPGGDFGYCKLSEPVTDVPIVPILMGCELDALVKGQEIALVGFGATRNGGRDAGTKRQVLTPVHDSPGKAGVPAKEILLGHSKKGACNGDSGGPAFVDLRTVDAFKDKKGAGWRVFGVTSRKGPGGGNCASTSAYGLIPKVVDWIEKDSGIDVTPCFDADGTWNPSKDCKGFPDPEAGGSWKSCDPGKVSGWSHTCGDNPHDKGEDGSGEDEDKDKDKDKDKDDEKSGEDEKSKDDQKSGEDEKSKDGDDKGEDEKNKDGDDKGEDKKEDDDNEDKSMGGDKSADSGKNKGKSSGDEEEEDADKKAESKDEDQDSADPGDRKKPGCSIDDASAPWVTGVLALLFAWSRRRRW